MSISKLLHRATSLSYSVLTGSMCYCCGAVLWINTTISAVHDDESILAHSMVARSWSYCCLWF